MHIGELARGAQVNIQTIRFYEREGLLRRPDRTEAGYRIYEARDLERVIFIKRNQELGFTLAEIKELHEIHRAFEGIRGPLRRDMKEVQAIICMGRQRLVTINQKIRLLHDMRRSLSSVVQHLEGSKVATCPVVQPPGKKKVKKSLK
ncbi:MAG: MerR family transcriptional regulator [Chthoniobacterales bacterium]|nr:MerR family transcriptional regulator [Chthoniobacterales bacterium]